VINRCPKCSTTMEQGFILDRTHGAVLAAEWVAGVPDRSIWTGIRNLRKRPLYQVMTHRCPKCGFVESYANDPVTPKWWRQ
jgi:predicted nucleic-acid-binding Zn-ribbon protein